MRCILCKELTIERRFESVEARLAEDKPRLRPSLFSREFPKETYYQHHKSILALEDSAREGCDLCQLFVDGLSSTQGRSHDAKNSTLDQARRHFGKVDTSIKIAMQSSYFISTRWSKVEMCDLVEVRIGDITYEPAGTSTYRLPVSIEFVLATPRDRPIQMNQFRIGRAQIDPTLDSPANIQLMKDWIDTCKKGHVVAFEGPIPSCALDASQGDPLLPSRIIDVGDPKESSPKIRLFVSKGIRAKYFALSHCWGGDIATKLTKETLGPFQENIPHDTLARNFQDAISIVRRLGERYIWIDCLCIVQDCRDDWSIESSKVADVYKGALLTIAACQSPSSSHGIIPRDNDLNPLPMPRSAPMGTSEDRAISLQLRQKNEESLSNLFHDNDYRCPLAARGWCLQESLLSRRVLYFGTQQIYWACGSGLKAANGQKDPMALRSLGNGPVMFHKFLYQHQEQLPLEGEQRIKLLDAYARTVSTYTSKCLTRGSDKLPALSGLAREINHSIGGSYVAGLWSNDLAKGLAWRRARDSLNQVNPYRAPSWSWASVDGYVEMVTGIYSSCNLKYDLRVLKYHTELENSQVPYGQVVGGHLVVQGLTVGLRRDHTQVQVDGYLYSPHTEGLCLWKLGRVYFDDPEIKGQTTGDQSYYNPDKDGPHILVGRRNSEDQDEIIWVQKDYLILCLTPQRLLDTEEEYCFCLILEAEKEENSYRRVGLLTVSGEYYRLIDWKEQTLKLI